MSNTRIRYTKVNNGLCRSRQIFGLPGGKEVAVQLDYNTFQFTIKNVVTDEVVLQGGATKNKAVLKIQAKRELEKLGAKFLSEERPSRRLSKNESEQLKI